MNNQRPLLIIIIILSIIILSGLALYFFKFHGSLSNDSDVWSDFSTFITLFLNVCSLIVIGYVSYLTFLINSKATNIAGRSLDLSDFYNRYNIMPVIDFSTSKAEASGKPSDPDSLFLMCLSNVGARNLQIRFWCHDLVGERKTYWILLNAMLGNSKLELFWLLHYTRIEVCFSDYLGQNYFHYEFNRIRGTLRFISENEFKELTLNEGDVITLDNVVRSFNKYRSDHWYDLPILNRYLDFFTEIENVV